MNSMTSKTTIEWAESLFGLCDLGDARRVKRLVSYAALQAEDPAGSTSKVCEARSSEAEAAYRLLRNPNISAQDIDNGAFASIAEECESRGLLLAIQDTTSVGVTHLPLAKNLKERGSPTGYLVHSTLMVDFEEDEVIGIIDQCRWLRKKARPGASTRGKRAYSEKESFKWQASHERMQALLPDKRDIITICDREGDIFDFISYHHKNESRYVIRSSYNRKTTSGMALWDVLESAPKFGEYKTKISQRGPGKTCEGKRRPARKERVARFELRAQQVILGSKNQKNSAIAPTKVNVIYLREITKDNEQDPLIWRLFTSENINSREDIINVIKMYEYRWLIEEYHKCWKSGCRIEERAFQSFSTVEIFLAISAHIATLLLQLKTVSIDSSKRERKAKIGQEEWECLQANAYPGGTISNDIPSENQVYRALAKLGGFLDTKRTKIAGWQTLWKGYYRFQERLSAWKLAKAFFIRNGEKM